MSRFPAAELAALTPRRICVVKPSALGDVVQALPLLGVLRDCYPEAEISWVINSGFANLLEDHPLLDELLLFERRGHWSSWGGLLRQLRRRRFDLVIDLQGLFRTGLMTWATRAPVRVGLQTAREGAWLANNCVLPETHRDVPAHARNWRLAEVLGRGDFRQELHLGVSEEDRYWARQLRESTGQPLLAISAGAQWVTKRWPIEKYAEVAAFAAERLGFAVALVGSPAEAADAIRLQEEISTRAPEATVLNLAGGTTLKRLAALLGEADLMLTNDSGPMHLAAGLGTPVTGVFLCTDAVRSGPPGPQHELVSTTVSCAASYRKQCPHTGAQRMCCMDELDVLRVQAALERCVDKNRMAIRRAA